MRTIDWEKVTTPSQYTLLTTVVQDTQGRVLMVLYLDEAAYQQTLATGYVTCFSRKEGKLRVQGDREKPKHPCKLHVVEERISCEGNALLLIVRPEGDRDQVCHHHGFSCFEEWVEGEEPAPMPAFDGSAKER